ncbi:zinc ribbon domain-containing protein [Paenibacillus polymyxa]|uniref:zinc ribbon domain-containing protein n=1 Tax=Paenibacillus polymyxa TaxID=1406 RepID=UPI00269E8136|nr:zinc ribbon domain-containing protein [Paenibacillus polymyxa]WPQ59494.1 zinc ribbon domain-containing protein [Paenibacillus polymyxa]
MDWCIAQSIKEVFVGDVGTVSQGTKKKQKLRRRERQKISNWNVGQQVRYLTYKLQAQGIAVTKVNEAYSTQTCPVCHQRHKPKGRMYRCRCGYVSHRDTHGAKNILSEQLYGMFTPIEENNLTYLRVA